MTKNLNLLRPLDSILCGVLFNLQIAGRVFTTISRAPAPWIPLTGREPPYPPVNLGRCSPS